MPKVSIVMPSYNVARFIRECMESVVNQTLTDIEIICVDKYSNDGTREILEEYASRDVRIKILNDDLGSCGYANNIGIAAASGKYIGIVETDDIIEPEMFEALYHIAENENLDYVKADFNEFTQDTNAEKIICRHQVLRQHLQRLYNQVFIAADYPELIWDDYCMWTGIYKKSFLVEHNVKFQESKGAAYQDHGFLWQVECQAGRVMYIDKTFYNYRKNNEFCSMNNPKALQMDLIELKFIRNFLDKYKKRNEIHMWFFYRKVYNALEARVIQYLNTNSEITPEFIECIQQYAEILEDGYSTGEISEHIYSIGTLEAIWALRRSVDEYLKLIKSRVQTAVILKTDLLNQIKGREKIIIFGCGENGNQLYWLLVNNKADNQVVCFCDNNSSRWGSKLLSNNIYSPEEATALYEDAYFIIANGEYYLDMRRQLLSLGISKSQILLYNKKLEDI